MAVSLSNSLFDPLCTCSNLLQADDYYDSTSNSCRRAEIQVNQGDDAPRTVGSSSQNDENENGAKVYNNSCSKNS